MNLLVQSAVVHVEKEDKLAKLIITLSELNKTDNLSVQSIIIMFYIVGYSKIHFIVQRNF